MGRVGYGYGCGVQVLVNPELVNAKAPAGVFGWDGAAGCYFSVSPEDNLAVFFARNTRPAANDIVPVLIMNTLYAAL